MSMDSRKMTLLTCLVVIVAAIMGSVRGGASCKEAVDDLHKESSFASTEKSFLKHMIPTPQDSDQLTLGGQSYSLSSDDNYAATYKDSCFSNNDDWCEAITITITWTPNGTAPNLTQEKLVGKGTGPSSSTKRVEGQQQISADLPRNSMGEYRTIRTYEDDGPRRKAKQSETHEDAAKAAMKDLTEKIMASMGKGGSSILELALEALGDPFSMLVNALPIVARKGTFLDNCFRGMLRMTPSKTRKASSRFLSSPESNTAKGQVGFCFPPECCQGSCDLSPMKKYIKDGAMAFLDQQCDSNQPEFCYEDGSVNVDSTTSCGSYTLFEIIVMITVTAGSAVLGCACLIILFRYICYRFRLYRRFGFSATEPLLSEENSSRGERIAELARRATRYSDISNPDKHHTSCLICLESFSDEEQVCKFTGCRHLFHRPCLEEWFRRKDTCPVCRTKWSCSTTDDEQQIQIDSSNEIAVTSPGSEPHS